MVAFGMAWAGRRARILQGIVVLTAAGVVAGPAVPGSAMAKTLSCAAAGASDASVAAVPDGDTLQLADGRVITLAGVEAPQPPLDQATDVPWPPAAAAKDVLEQVVGGRAVSVSLAAGEPDRYGRWRAQVFVDGAWVQERLVAAGWARVHPYPTDPPCVFSLLESEQTARQANLGLWATGPYKVLDALGASLERRNGLYELVEGRVRSVGHGRTMIFLDFGYDYRRDFTIMVPAKVAERFEAAGVPLDGLKGRPVRVRGVIEESGGPAIRVYDPAEIEVLDDKGD